MSNVNNASETFEAGAADLSESAEQAARSISSGMSTAGEVVRDAVKRTGDAVGKGYEQLSHKARDSYQHGRETMHDLEVGLENQIQQRPVSAVLVALGAGVAIGYLLRVACE